MTFGVGQRRLQDRVAELEKNQKKKTTSFAKPKPKPSTPSRPRSVTAKADTRSRRNLMRGSAMREPVISTAYDE